jgi:hypothetical protein
MTGMVTYAGLDVHARSTHAAALDVSTGELVRAVRAGHRGARCVACGFAGSGACLL